MGRVEGAGFLWVVAVGGVVLDSAAGACGKAEGEEGVKRRLWEWMSCLLEQMGREKAMNEGSGGSMKGRHNTGNSQQAGHSN